MWEGTLKPSEHLKNTVPVISEEFQKILWWLGIGTLNGFIWGFMVGVIVS